LTSLQARPAAAEQVQNPRWLQKGITTSMAQDQQSLKPKLTLAAKYVRMSTEHQQYSIDNQADAISRYAQDHEMEIVRTYIDSGKSGLTIENRPGLRQLIADAESGFPGFTAVLVYDVGRWGRFQDVDESAFYEYRCRRARIALHYSPSSSPTKARHWRHWSRH
jgi:DNA invertase Pin-like site-specific DNA recombinase